MSKTTIDLRRVFDDCTKEELIRIMAKLTNIMLVTRDEMINILDGNSSELKNMNKQDVDNIKMGSIGTIVIVTRQLEEIFHLFEKLPELNDLYIELKDEIEFARTNAEKYGHLESKKDKNE